MHEDPVTKSKRVTNSSGAIFSKIELDPWGADTNRSLNVAFQPKKFTSYERDGNGSDEAMFRRYNRWQSRFDQPDPYDGSYNAADPQSFNRYAYVQGDPVNFVDPSGLAIMECGTNELGDPIYCTVTNDRGTEYRWVLNSRFGGIGDRPRGGGGAGFDIPGITDAVNNILSQQACIDFFNRILNSASSKDNPTLRGGNLQDIFKDFLAQKNGGFTRTKPPGSAGYGSATGLIRKGNGKIFSPAYSTMSSAEQTAYDAGTTVAELFHMAGRNEYYTDRALAEAAHSIPEFAAKYRGFMPEHNVFDPRYGLKADAAKNPNHGGWSSYFHDIQRQLCGP